MRRLIPYEVSWNCLASPPCLGLLKNEWRKVQLPAFTEKKKSKPDCCSLRVTNHLLLKVDLTMSTTVTDGTASPLMRVRFGLSCVVWLTWILCGKSSVWVAVLAGPDGVAQNQITHLESFIRDSRRCSVYYGPVMQLLTTFQRNIGFCHPISFLPHIRGDWLCLPWQLE